MSSRRSLVFLALTGALAAPAAASAAPAAPGAVGIGHVTVARVALTGHTPDASAGLHVLVKGKLPGRGVTEAAGVRQTIVLPRGASVDTRGARRCTASASELAARGAEGACPAASRVGTGRADGVLDGAPTSFDVGIYAFPRLLLFAAEQDGKPLKQAFQGRIRQGGRRLVLDVPTLGGRIAPTRFEANVAVHARRGHRLVSTPASCPAKGWRIVTAFQGLSAVPGGHPVGRAQRHVLHEACRPR